MGRKFGICGIAIALLIAAASGFLAIRGCVSASEHSSDLVKIIQDQDKLLEGGRVYSTADGVALPESALRFMRQNCHDEGGVLYESEVTVQGVTVAARCDHFSESVYDEMERLKMKVPELW